MNIRHTLILLLWLLSKLVLAEDYSTPRALLNEKARLESGPCDLNCQMKIAGMYSTKYLDNLRSAVMLGLRNEAYRKENMMLLFGEEIPMNELEAMSSQEFFARQLAYRERTTPAELRFSRLDIISEKMISDSETQILVLRSGLAADPQLKEEGMALIYVPRDTPGLSFGKPEDKMSMRVTDANAAIYFDDVRVPREYRASGPGKDWQLFVIAGASATARVCLLPRTWRRASGTASPPIRRSGPLRQAGDVLQQLRIESQIV